MSSLKILIKGDQRLRKKSRVLEKKEFLDYLKFAENLTQIMEIEKGIGIAAPQVGENIRMICIHKDAFADKKHLLLINPKITFQSRQTIETEEGCLSVPGVMGLVRRPEKIRVKYFDFDGNKHQLKAKAMLSCVLQHEIDHLNGILFVDKTYKITKNEGKVKL